MRQKPLPLARADEGEDRADVLEGWQVDPDGLHDARYFSQGLATNRVRDGSRFSWDRPADLAPALGADGAHEPDGVAPAAIEPEESAGGSSGQSTETGVPPAWYPDPSDRTWMRYWDGAGWTDAVVPMPPATVAGAEEPHTAVSPVSPPSPTAPAAAHYVVLPGSEGGRAGALAPEGVALVTGEVPLEYDRVLVECQDGKVVEATVLTAAAVPGTRVFVALVSTPAARILATRLGGVHGIFLDVGGPDRVAAANPSSDGSLRLHQLP